MSDYDDSERVVCPACKGDGMSTLTTYYVDSYGREQPVFGRGTCSLCGGDRLVDKVTTYRRLGL